MAGTQRARFDGTGLIVTGVGTFSGATSTTTLTASTSVVTPLVGTDAVADFSIKAGGTNMWSVLAGSGILRPVAGQGIGDAAHIVASITTSIIDSGTIGSLLLKTNNGALGIEIQNATSPVNYLSFLPGAAATAANLLALGEANTALQYFVKGTGGHSFFTGTTGNQGAGAVGQFQILHTASATRNVTVTGSNGGNPTLGVTAGSLAITPAVVIAGASLQIGTNPATSANSLAVPYNTVIASRNSANTNDIGLIAAITVNAVTDVSVLGTAATSAGTHIRARTGAAAPTTSDLPASFFTVWRDSGGATTKLYYNNAGAIQSVALA